MQCIICRCTTIPILSLCLQYRWTMGSEMGIYHSLAGSWLGVWHTVHHDWPNHWLSRDKNHELGILNHHTQRRKGHGIIRLFPNLGNHEVGLLALILKPTKHPKLLNTYLSFLELPAHPETITKPGNHLRIEHFGLMIVQVGGEHLKCASCGSRSIGNATVFAFGISHAPQQQVWTEGQSRIQPTAIYCSHLISSYNHILCLYIIHRLELEQLIVFSLNVKPFRYLPWFIGSYSYPDDIDYHFHGNPNHDSVIKCNWQLVN